MKHAHFDSNTFSGRTYSLDTDTLHGVKYYALVLKENGNPVKKFKCFNRQILTGLIPYWIGGEGAGQIQSRYQYQVGSSEKVKP